MRIVLQSVEARKREEPAQDYIVAKQNVWLKVDGAWPTQTNAKYLCQLLCVLFQCLSSFKISHLFRSLSRTLYGGTSEHGTPIKRSMAAGDNNRRVSALMYILICQ